MTRRFLLLGFMLAVLSSSAVSAGAAVRLDRTERAVIRHINAFRAEHGLAVVRPAWRLHRAAEEHSRDMQRREFFDHASSDGTPFHVRVRRFTPNATVGETLARLAKRAGAATTVVRMWKDSPPHRAILLEPGFRRVGVARRWGPLAGGQTVWTADFASP